MKLYIFQSDKGDCLLLEGESGHLVLCDGGMGPSMRNHVRAELAAFRDEDRALDFVYISHIDNDHIGGVSQLLQDEVEWRVFDHHQKNGTPVREPKAPRPPVINGILHNSFRDQITANDKPIEGLIAARAIEDLLGAMAPTLYGSGIPEFMSIADDMQAIATGVPEAIKVSKLIAAEALDIPLNRPPGVPAGEPAGLLFAGRPGETFQLGSMHFTLIGPTKEELEDLRDGWNNWLRGNKERLKKIRAEIKKRVDEFSNSTLTESPFDLRDWEGIPGFENVTVPNIASLMFVVQEGDATLLLTGDAHHDFILEGLRRTGFLADDGVNVSVLKVQHHGSENNMDINFARQVSADHYVFCGNGEHENPDLRVIDIIFNSRIGDLNTRSLSAEAQDEDREFHFWFSTTADAQAIGTKKREHFQEVQRHVALLRQRSGGRLKIHFNADSVVVLEV